MRILDTINDPADLRGLPVDQLKALAREIRDYIAEVVKMRGGHFGGPAGTVELTLALHKVFNTPRDKIVWDVGHQAYAHKIITGRREAFKTLRSYKGIAGFLKRSESIYDTFGAGHASTSISAAVGFAIARDRRGSDEKVVAIIGDGAMTGGLAFEGLNNAGSLGTDVLVILNDNKMSIAGNVGALSNYLNRLLTAPLYHRVKDDIEDLVTHINERTMLDRRFPGVAKLGHQVLEKATKLKEGIKNMVLPSLLFEELGFTYYGPVDGHNLDELIPMLEHLKPLRSPILLHVITAKGKGFEWTETHPERGHAAKAGFDPKSGKSEPPAAGAKTAPTWTGVFAQELIRMSEEDPDVVAITAAMPSGTGLDQYMERFPERCYDVGIAEGHAVVSAAAMAAGGLKPVVAIYSTFLQRAFDMIIHDVCIQKLPVFFALDRGGIVGDDGETHMGAFDMGYLRMIPNMRLMVPKDEAELRAMMRMGVNCGAPAAVRFPRGNVVVSPAVSTPIEWGKAEVMREGSDAVVLAFGPLTFEALQIAQELEKELGVSIGVVNMRFVKPMDAELVLKIGREVGRIVTYEEGALATGAGTAVLEILADAGVKSEVRRVGIPDQFVEHGDPKLTRRDLGLSPDDLRRVLKELVGHPVTA
jgi:1-deoxy-D-xylulose-5-phosphate synthase